MKPIKNLTPHFYGYDNNPRNEEGKILLDRADDGKIVIKRKNTLSFGSGLLALCDGAKISVNDWQDLRRGFYLEEPDGTRKYHYCVGGSDAGAIMGNSPYSSALDIFKAKKHFEDKPISDTTQYLFEYGHIVEPLIAKGFAHLTKLDVFKNDCVFFNENNGFMQANVDYFVREPKGNISILEIKTTSPNSTTAQLADKNEVPDTYYTQAVLHYPLTLSPAFNIVGTYFAIGTDNILENIKICHFGRDPLQEKMLLQSESEFVDSLFRDNPPKDHMVPTKRLEKSGLKQTEAKQIAIDLDDAAKTAAEEYTVLSAEEKRINETLKPIKKRKEELQAIICERLGDAATSTPFTKDGITYIAKWDSYIKETVNKTVLKCKYPDIYEDTVSASVVRKFNLSDKEEKK